MGRSPNPSLRGARTTGLIERRATPIHQDQELRGRVVKFGYSAQALYGLFRHLPPGRCSVELRAGSRRSIRPTPILGTEAPVAADP